tara:strand:- start:2544 stop:3143 length:600 start_codon:yes stop_codon:yes gene_type:complete
LGTDINAFLEKTDREDSPSFSGIPHDQTWLFGKFCINRDYHLFDALANGRSVQFDPSEVERHALYPPRGIPADLSYDVAIEYYDLIMEPADIDSRFSTGYEFVSKSEAEIRVSTGRSHYGQVTALWPYSEKSPLWSVVSKPYFHNPGWLTLEEIREALDHFKITMSEVDIEFRALLRAMEELDQESSPWHVRLTFWFEK